MPYVATRGAYALQIEYDDDAPNPREDMDNFGTMVCWHRRYNLGDNHTHERPRDFLASLVEDIPAKEIIDYAKKGCCENVRLAYDRSAGGWELESYDSYFKKWFHEYFIEGKLAGSEGDMADAIRDCLPIQDLIELAERRYWISPLYLYDHSGISISMSDFRDWDSGQVGWVYVSKNKIKEEFGAVTPETMKKAETLLRGETECYDCYLTGECYGFRFYKDGIEEDSCWGFLGSLNEVQDDIECYLPEACKGITGELRLLEPPVRSVDVSDFWEPPDEDEAQEADQGQER